MKLRLVLLHLALFFVCSSLATAERPIPLHTFAIGDQDFLLDGHPLQIRCGEIHFARVPREYWTHRLRMAKAMGLNTVCVYLFWNFHEWKEGSYDWSGMADAAEFCRLAQKEGLWVILRPGPYSCAEWEMGGLPWWLLKSDQIQLRTKDPAFLQPATRFLKEVGRVLGPEQITHGGPLLMVQVENEYGSYGHDADYMGALRQALIDGGFDVPLFACNPPDAIKNGYRKDLFQVVNFGGGGAEKSFAALRKIQPRGPLMNGEYYPGWFDTWGQPHHRGNLATYLADLEYMLKNDESFSIYMAHGGTSFGLWSGADRPFSPDTSSYDYDAPISEAGWATEKFTRTRELVQRLLPTGETLPPVPPANPVIVIPAFTLSQTAPLFSNLPAPVSDSQPRTMEAYDQSRGCMVYRTTLPAGPAGELTVRELHDYGWIFLDNKLTGVMDRRSNRYTVELPARSKPVRLDLLVEAVGRVNFGREVFDRKGLYGPANYTTGNQSSIALTGWQVFSLPLDAEELSQLHDQSATASDPAFWRGTFNLGTPGDTFLDLRRWGKGVVWVNGHCLGRFWNIGPTQTMYLPGPWLRRGRNSVVVLDLIGPQSPQLAGLEKPILDELHPELDFARRIRATGLLQLDREKPVGEGHFAPAQEWQIATFRAPVKGRYLCLEALNGMTDSPVAAIAELDVLGPKGESLAKNGWKILWVDSEAISGGTEAAENMLDGQSATSWRTETTTQRAGYPHHVVLDFGSEQTVTALRYLPQSGSPAEAGEIKDYRVYLSDSPFGLKSH